MQGIKLNQQGIKAILNGSKTMTRRPLYLEDRFEMSDTIHLNGMLISPTGIMYAHFSGYDSQDEFYEASFSIFPKYKVGETVFIQEEFRIGAWQKNKRYDTTICKDVYSQKIAFDYRNGIDKSWKAQIDDDLISESIDWLVKNNIESKDGEYEWEKYNSPLPWRHKSEMQERQARLFLKIKSIKVENLQDISEEDCIKEGVLIGFDSSKSAIFNPVDHWDEDCQHRTAEEAFSYDIWQLLPYQEPYRWGDNPPVFVYEFEKVEK